MMSCQKIGFLGRNFYAIESLAAEKKVKKPNPQKYNLNRTGSKQTFDIMFDNIVYIPYSVYEEWPQDKIGLL